MSVYRIMVSTSSIYEVKSNTEEEAIKAVEDKLHKENPREIYKVEVIQDAEIKEN